MRKIVLILLLGCCGFSHAEEYIEDFHSDIRVTESGDVLVTETITVHVEHKDIKRGIFRDFPTQYKTALYTKSTVDFSVLEVLRNGEYEPHHLKDMSNGVRVYIGSRNQRVPTGKQVYQLKYLTNRQIAFMEDHDRFAWNVTGNGWKFKIAKVSAKVELPNGVSMAMVDSGVWTGFAGETGANFNSDIQGNVLKINSTRALNPYQGLTFSLDIPKGHIIDESNALLDFLSDNLMWVLMVITLLSLLMFYVLAWHQVGRDPEPGVIIPLFYPPKNMSPAAMRYVLDEKTDHKNFTAALINLAVKGRVKLKQLSSGYEVTKLTTDSHNPMPISSGENIIMKRLFKSQSTVYINKSYDSKVKDAIKKVNNRIKLEYKKKCYMDNRVLGYLGIVISVFALLFLMIHFNVLNGEMFGGFVVLFVVAGYALFTAIKTFKGSADIGNIMFFGFMAFTLFSNMGQELPLEVIVFGVFLIVVNGLFIYLLKSPTPFGRTMMDEIEGFKLYLSTAEQHRLDVMHPPNMSPELFEKYLPYAMALGVENKWSQRLARHLRSVGQDSNDDSYQPNWYSGGNFNLSSSSQGFSAISSTMASTISSAATPPSSSGSGGGGFSGGGGGGGGGGGW